MSEKILDVRIPQKIDTTENWNNSTLILKDGELGVEKLDNGSKKFKWGDGVNVWSNLPYATGEALNHIFDGIANGSVRTSLSTSETVDYKLGTAAFAEGQGTEASGNFSHAEGFNTSATGAYSHSEGRQTTASGSVAHAEGTDTVASGIRSHAGGYGTIAKGENQTAIGKYNVQDDANEFAFIVGNGTSIARSNAFTVDWSGNVKANGKKIATEEYVAQNGGSIDTIKVNGENLTITEKSVNIEIPTKTSELTNDSGFLDTTETDSKINNLKNELIGTDSSSLESDTIKGAKKYADTKVADIAALDNSVTVENDNTNVSIGVKISEAEENALSLETDGLKVNVPAATEEKYGTVMLSDINDYTSTSRVVTVSYLNNARHEIATSMNSLTHTAPDGKYISKIVYNQADNTYSVTDTSLPDYTVSIAESSPEGYAKAYTITQAATGLNTTINIPKDMVVQSGTVETKLTSGEWGLAGTYLILTLANATSDKVYIDVSTLIEYVTSGSGANDAIQIAISNDHKVTATIKDNSIELGKLSASVQASLNKADAAATQASVTALESTVSAHTTKLAGIEEGANKTIIDTALSDTSTNPVQNNVVNAALASKAAADLTNIDNAIFKVKVEASGFSSGTLVQLIRWETSD